MLHLTGRCYLLLLIIAMLGIIGQWHHAEYRDLWHIPTALLLLILTIEWCVFRQRSLFVQRLGSEKVPLGKEAYVALQISNRQGSRLQVQAVQALSEDMLGEAKILNWDLQPNGSARRQFNIIPQTLGELQWAPVYVRILGLFGFAWWEKKLSLPSKMEVIPDRLSYKERAQGTTRMGERTLYSSGSGMELLGLRDYLPGDPLRNIDWKATARSGKRTVRLLMQEQHLELMLMIDVGHHSKLHSAGLTRLHHNVNVAARLAERALVNGDSVGMITYADKPQSTIRPARKQATLKRIRRELTSVTTQNALPNPLLAMSEVLNNLTHRAMIIIFTDVEREDIDGQLSKAIELATPKHFTVIASILDEDILRLKNQTARQWLEPYHSLAATEALQITQQNMMFLNRLGAKIIYTRVKYLDKTVLNYYATLRTNKKI